MLAVERARIERLNVELVRAGRRTAARTSRLQRFQDHSSEDLRRGSEEDEKASV